MICCCHLPLLESCKFLFLQAMLLLDVYNAKKMGWEPVIEPFQFGVGFESYR